MLTGGYQIIDLGGINHESGSSVKHEGIYAKIEGTKKPLLFSGVVVDGTEYQDAFLPVHVSGTSYEALYQIGLTDFLAISISDSDEVYVTPV